MSSSGQHNCCSCTITCVCVCVYGHVCTHECVQTDNRMSVPVLAKKLHEVCGNDTAVCAVVLSGTVACIILVYNDVKWYTHV